MADSAGKSLDQLKRERTTARSCFTRQANFIARRARNMSKTELTEEFAKLSVDMRRVIDTNDEYRTSLLMDAAATSECSDEAALDDQLEDELEKITIECETRHDDVKKIVQSHLWTKYGAEEIAATFNETEKACEYANSIAVDSSNCEAYEVHLALLEKLSVESSEVLSKWDLWIPQKEQAELQKQLRELKVIRNRLESRKSEFARARRIAEVESTAAPSSNTAALTMHTLPAVKLKPIKLPIFSGDKRYFYSWKKDWETLQGQGEPTGSGEVKRIQLLDSVDERIAKELRLPGYNTAEDILRVLENRYGNKTMIAMEIVEELDRIPPVKGHQPRRVVELVQAVEKALADLTSLGNVGAIKNPLVVKTIESKLPDLVKKDWLVFMLDASNSVTPDNHFDELIKFLKKQEEIFERLEQLKTSDRASDRAETSDRPEKRYNRKYAMTKVTRQSRTDHTCIVCGDYKHKDKLFFCKKFKGLSLAEKESVVKDLGACRKCLGCHEDPSECRDSFLCRNRECREARAPSHHFALCPRDRYRKDSSEKQRKKPLNGLTEEQAKFLNELPPELAEKGKKAFTNSAARGNAGNQVEPLRKRTVQELPVIMMLMEVTANAGEKVGTLIDLASDTNYITHRAANRLNLRSEKITLVVHGVGGMSTKVYTRRYLLKVRVKSPTGSIRAHEIVCYGLKEIAKVHQVVSPEKLKKFFPEAEIEELKRPERIELLIGHREGRLAPQRARVVEDLVLWDGPLGKTVGGAHPDLFEKVEVRAHRSGTHFARSMRTAALRYEEATLTFKNPHKRETLDPHRSTSVETRCSATNRTEFLEWWKWDSIGAACEPKCGGCRCGNCQPGGKEMTLAEERELEIIKAGLTYVLEDAHSKSPHWDAKYPWVEDPGSLPHNRKCVEATFLKTERQLKREPEWRAAYSAQVHEMVERGAAKRLSKETVEDWLGPVWYISHLIALNPHSATTPVRLVWNSSQRFEGVSLNDLLLKGPDVLNPIRAVLIRFRRGVHAALGDIKKMYNSVWLEEREMHLHRFLWRDSEEEEIGEYAVTRVNIGDRPAGCIAQLAMRETARLQKFAHLSEARRVLEEDSYVDDILTSHNNMETLDKLTKEVEEILRAGGFSLKPWVRSGQSGRSEGESGASRECYKLTLPNQISDEDNKALGMGYLAEEDKFYMMTAINFSKKKGKMRTAQDLQRDEVRANTPDPLTRRDLLSQVAGLFDPMGLATPIKQKGAILVRKAFQEVGKGEQVQDTWDKPLSEGLREEAIGVLEEYIELGQVKFHRGLTPSNWHGEPWGITFSDGSDKSYGAVMYLRWETLEGIKIRLVESKAKLTPVDQKGDAVKAELCGAVFAARLKKHFEKYSSMKVGRWFHLVDSQTVLGAIQRDSYGYQTFFANRVGEIQKTGPVSDWWWIPGMFNIADAVTRGAAPRDLDENSSWQKGPEFLSKPLAEWPIKSAGEIATGARESVSRLQRKAFSAVVTRSQSRTDSADEQSERIAQKELVTRIARSVVDIERFSSLSRLIGACAWVRRAIETWLELRSQAKNNSALEREKRAALTAREREDAFAGLLSAAQEVMTLNDTTVNRLVVHRDDKSGLLVCGGRTQAFSSNAASVPILPYEAWISFLVAQEAHYANHEGVAGTLLRMRKRAWVIRGQKLARKVIDRCVICRKIRAKQCQQVMGQLPQERVNPAAPFEFTAVDLFGPFEVKGEVQKRVRLKVWGIVFCCMASRAMHTDVVSSLSAEGFLLAYARFTALRGNPRKVWSDPGSNFIGAKPALEDLHRYLRLLKESEVDDKAARQGTEWSWKIHPADSPHRNGAAEAAVHVVKRALHNLIGSSVLSWSELQTFLYMAANLANERPIEARIQGQEDCVEYVTPNSLLLGRTGSQGDFGDYQFTGYPYKRLRVIQTEVNKFWNRWCQLAGPNLFTRSKWHTRQRNVTVGDVVWLADQNALRGQYKLGRVVRVNPDSKGIVRDVHVRVFPSYPVLITKPVGKGAAGKDTNTTKTHVKLPATILHRDVRRLVILVPVEEQ